MLIHDNIKFLRKSKRLSQEKFAEQLGINRGNVASYERTTIPPLKVLRRISTLYGIAIDELMNTKLADSQFINNNLSIASVSDWSKRLGELLEYVDKNIDNFGESIGMMPQQVSGLLDGDETLWNAEVIVGIANAYPWIRLEWLLRGKGGMIGTRSVVMSEVAEEPSPAYLTAKRMDAMEAQLVILKLRIDQLEKATGMTN